MRSFSRILALAAALSPAFGLADAAACKARSKSSVAAAAATSTTAKASSVAKATQTTAALSSTTAVVAHTTAAAASSSSKAAASSSSTSSSGAKASSSTSSNGAKSSSSASSSGTKYMVVFGDSYSSTGFWITSGYPSSSNAMGNGESTTSGGLNWAGMTTETYNTSLVLTYDFAVYGASVDTDIVRGSTPGVNGQVDYFNEYLASAPSYAPWTADDLLVAVWIGINDVGNSWWDGTATPIDEDLDEYFTLMTNLTASGVTNFAFLTVPPFQYAPQFLSESNTDALISNITAYNTALTTRAAEFQSANSGVTATVFETEEHFLKVINDPTSYGATDASCSNTDGTTCIWYDSYHAGQAIHKEVAQAFVETMTGTFF